MIEKKDNMTVQEKYREIFEREIVQESKSVIFPFSPVANKYKYQPYVHNVSPTAVEDLGKLMRENLIFYAFGEEEIVQAYEKGKFNSLEMAAKYAYKQRLPERSEKVDGLPSEVLLDLLIQIYEPDAYKLTVRTIFRQDDKNEIKGYDLTYFTKNDNEIVLWLGQAKLGEKNYCKIGIDHDLTKKYKAEYLTEQLYFISDKPVKVTNDAKEILEVIDNINARMIEEDPSIRTRELLDYLTKEQIKVRIPCLLAYSKNSVYSDARKIYEKIQDEIDSIQKYYTSHNYVFEHITPEIIFYIFPIESIERLRDREKGFYAGLHK